MNGSLLLSPLLARDISERFSACVSSLGKRHQVEKRLPRSDEQVWVAMFVVCHPDTEVHVSLVNGSLLMSPLLARDTAQIIFYVL